MKTKRIVTHCWPVILILMSAAGCAAPPASTPNPSAPKPNVTTAQDFQEPSSKTPNAIQSAIELSKKVAELSEQLTALREENFRLTTETQKQKTQISELEPELQQTQKELREANDLLIEMRLEINNWKEDILGFRSEMRDADQAQLEALLKILQLLGGEIIPETPNPVKDQKIHVESDPNV